MREKSNVILIGPLPPPITGQSISFEMLVRGLDDAGYNFFVIDISRKSARNSSVALFSRGLEFVKAVILLTRYLLFLTNKKVYLTIAQSRKGFFRDFIFIWLCTVFGAKIIIHLKGGNYDGFYGAQGYFLRLVIRVTLRRADKVLVLGAALSRMFDFEPSLRDRIIVVHNGLPNHAGGRAKSYSNETPLKILFLSNLIESKGYLDVVRSIFILRDYYKIEVEGIFAGEFLTSDDDIEKLSITEKRDEFFNLISTLDLTNQIHYIGVVTGEEKWRLLQQAHFFCLPTNYINEGQPVSIIEAMAYGCVILSTEIKAITDLIQDGMNGKFVRYASPEFIAKTIAQIIKQGQFNNMSKGSIRIFNGKFTREIHLKKLVGAIVD